MLKMKNKLNVIFFIHKIKWAIVGGNKSIDCVCVCRYLFCRKWTWRYQNPLRAEIDAFFLMKQYIRLKT